MNELWQPGDPEDFGLDLDLLEALSGFRLDDNPLPGSDPWLQTISASKVAVIMGYAPKKWGTRHSLYHQIIGTTPREAPNLVQARGHDFEPLILKWYARDNPDADVRPTRAWAHKDRLWQTATPDALSFLKARVRGIEAKTADDIRDWGEPGPGQRLPLYYLCQIQWQMDTIGYDETDLAAVGPTCELSSLLPLLFVSQYRNCDDRNTQSQEHARGPVDYIVDTEPTIWGLGKASSSGKGHWRSVSLEASDEIAL